MQPNADSYATTRPLPVDTDEFAGMIAARRQLGPESEEAMIASFLNRMGQAIDQRVDYRVAQHTAAGYRAPARGGRTGGRVVLAIASLVVGLLVTTVAADHGLYGLIIAVLAWIAVVAVNTGHGPGR